MADSNETQGQNAESDELKFAIPEKGYGVYLKGILPEDQRVLAGAFSTSMQQIRNIDQIQIEKFAQAVYSNENMFGLNLVNGTDVPTDVNLARITSTITALGGGVYGTYTMSNFFGAMSGLPYPLAEIYKGIKDLETDVLAEIYQNLYLAVTWEQALCTVITETRAVMVSSGSPATYDWQYQITSIILDDKGGGYGREGEPKPGYTWGGADFSGSGGVEPEYDIGIIPGDLGTFGRIINFETLNAPGTWVTYVSGTTDPDPTPPDVTLTIDIPPDDGTGGWPISDDPSSGMNTVVQNYIDEANNEIQTISVDGPSNFTLSNLLNTHWIITGKAMKQEQRARYISTAPVPSGEWDRWVANYPTSMYIFVDAIPTLSGNTLPHMYAQTLENISDLDLVGGQSVVGLMRESRNQERLNNAGLGLDNNLANDLNPDAKEQLIANGVLPEAEDGINGYTIPAFAGQDPNGDLTAIPVPAAYYDPCLPGMVCYNEIQYVESNPVAAILEAPNAEPVEEEIEPSPEGYEPPPQPEILPAGSDVVTPDFNFPCEGSVVEPLYGPNPAPVATLIIGTGAATACDPPPDYPIGVNIVKPIVPPELDAELTAATLAPSAPTVQQAIDQVIKCNCDCWVA